MSAPYELYAQREMNDLAARNGALTAELKIVRCTLRAIQPTMDGWEADEIRDLINRLDIALEDRT